MCKSVSSCYMMTLLCLSFGVLVLASASWLYYRKTLICVFHFFHSVFLFVMFPAAFFYKIRFLKFLFAFLSFIALQSCLFRLLSHSMFYLFWVLFIISSLSFLLSFPFSSHTFFSFFVLNFPSQLRYWNRFSIRRRTSAGNKKPIWTELIALRTIFLNENVNGS